MSNRPARSLPLKLLLGAAMLLHVLFYYQLWAGMLGVTKLRRSDFLIFYTAGRILQAEGGAKLYDLDAQQSTQAGLYAIAADRAHMLPFNHPAYIAVLPAAIVGDDYR